jgi:hypothetical protein
MMLWPDGIIRHAARFLAQGQLLPLLSISTRVNKPENDDPSIVEPIELAPDAA